MIGDSTLTAEERAFQAQCSNFLASHLPPDLVAKMDANEVLYPREFIGLLGKHGYLGVCIPRELGGGGRDILSDALVNEEMGYHGSAALACARTFTTHVGWVIYKYGSKALHERYLRPMLRGERIVCQGLTEPSAGSDLASLQATARRDGDQYVVNGEKRFIDGAQTCDFIDLAVRTGESADPRQSISVVLVDTDHPGYRIKQVQSDWMGFRGMGSSWVEFVDVPTPVTNLVGQENGGWPYLMEELLLERVIATRAQLGQARKALEVAVNYAAARPSFGRKLKDYQWVSFQVADMATKLDAAALLNTRAARLLDQGMGDDARMEVAMAKRFGVDAAWEVADTSLQIVGGIGYTKSYPIERICRDIRASRLTAGSTEMMALIIQKRVFANMRNARFSEQYVGHEAERPELRWG